MSPQRQFYYKVDYEVSGRKGRADIVANCESQAKQRVIMSHPGAAILFVEVDNDVQCDDFLHVGQLVVIPNGQLARVKSVTFSRTILSIVGGVKHTITNGRTGESREITSNKDISVATGRGAYGVPTDKQIEAAEAAEGKEHMKKSNKAAKAVKIKTPKECLCGCGQMTGGGRFRPGHDATLKSRLVKACADGRTRVKAAATLTEMGWASYIPKVEKPAEPKAA
jgi:hypothetical protein